AGTCAFRRSYSGLRRRALLGTGRILAVRPVLPPRLPLRGLCRLETFGAVGSPGREPRVTWRAGVIRTSIGPRLCPARDIRRRPREPMLPGQLRLDRSDVRLLAEDADELTRSRVDRHLPPVGHLVSGCPGITRLRHKLGIATRCGVRRPQ